MLFRRTHPQERISSAHFGVSHDGATDLVHEVKQIQGSLAGAACTEVGFLSQSKGQTSAHQLNQTEMFAR